MKIQDPRREHPPFDIVDGQWPLYKSQGYHQHEEPNLTPLIEVNWFVRRGRFIGDYECPPFIAWSATNGTKGYCESTQGTAHRTVKVYIPGQKPVTCPENIGQEYVRLFAEWIAKSTKKNGELKKPPVEHVSTSTGPAKKGEAWGGVLNPAAPWSHDVEFRGKK